MQVGYIVKTDRNIGLADGVWYAGLGMPGDTGQICRTEWDGYAAQKGMGRQDRERDG
jgi:hypothetical protein